MDPQTISKGQNSQITNRDKHPDKNKDYSKEFEFPSS